MNTKTRNYLLLLLFGFLSMPMMMAQQTRTYYNYDRDWTLGFHGGLSWQDSDDMYDRVGAGFGMTLGKRVYGQPGSAFALDWRGRFTYSNSFGQGSLRNTDIATNNLLNGIGSDANYTNLGFVYNNYRTDMVDVDIEAVLTLNRLRERYGVVGQLFGGLGLDFYDAKIDQLNSDGSIYDYASIDDTNQTSGQIRRDLYSLRNESFRDGVYEGGEGTKLTFMPSWGFGIGYQPVQWFSFGYEHRFAYPFTDKLDVNEGNSKQKDWVNDIHHLSSLYARFHFGLNGDCLPPSIRVTTPTANPYSTQAPSITVAADIVEVSSRNNIEVTVNDLPNYSYSFNASSDRFSMPVLLQNGENVIRIVARNSCEEQDVAIIRVIYNPNIVGGTPPVVAFTSPSTNQYTTFDDQYNIIANVERVSSKTDIGFRVNGESSRQFSYRNGQVQSNVNLRLGSNTVEITGKNRFGEDTKTITIIQKEKEVVVNQPRVRITRPSNDPHRTSAQSQSVVAQIDNVDSKSNVTFTVNGRRQSFNYNSNTGKLQSTITLLEGQNIVEVTGSNDAGTDKDRTTIIFERNIVNPPVSNPPRVTVTRPSNNPHSTSEDTYEIRATVRNVGSKNQVEFRMNGRNISSFSYNPSTDAFRATVNLEEGANVFKITATNADGTDSDDGNIVYKRETVEVSPPKVDITSPNNGVVVYTSSERVKAIVRNIDRKSQITFKVNGNVSNAFSYNANTDKFEANVSLVTGANTVEITAANSAGTDQDNVIIMYREVTNPPVITITRPTSNPATVTQATTVIKASITNISSKSQLTFKLNGSNSSFTFNPSTKVLTANVTLVEGANRFNITAQNDGGRDEDGGVIVYKKDITPTIQPPTVNVLVPSANPHSTNKNRQAISANITNVSNRSGIKLTLNGRTVNSFSYNGTTGRLSATVVLKEGNNTFKVTGTNTAGSDNDGGTIIYKKAVTISPPQVVITRPANNTKVTVPREVIKATISNIQTKSQITFTVNGRTSNDFTFNASNGQFSGNTQLNNGNNLIVISARNSAGKDSDDVNVKYETRVVGCDKPVISMTFPTANPFTTTRNDFAVRAKVTKVQSASNIQVSVRGSSISTWIYNTGSKELYIDYTNWVVGNNRVKITATNDCGTTTKEITIIYKQVNPPSVRFMQPVGNGGSINSNKSRLSVAATVKNVDKRQIKFTINGKRASYNLSGDRLTAGIDLVTGMNTVKIVAQNDGGKDEQFIKIDYSKPVLPPVISFTKPRGSVTVSSSSYNIRAKVTNKNSKQDIVVNVNGQSLSSFSFNTTSGTLSFNANLKEGTNTIQIVARNSAGADMKSVTIRYTKPAAPTNNRNGDSKVNNGNNGGTSVITPRSVPKPQTSKPRNSRNSSSSSSSKNKQSVSKIKKTPPKKNPPKKPAPKKPTPPKKVVKKPAPKKPAPKKVVKKPTPKKVTPPKKDDTRKKREDN